MRRSAGFTLVEALIAILVLSIGLLGVAAMQIKALQSAHVGYQRSIASLAAQDAVELMWSKLPYDCDVDSLYFVDWHSRWEEHLPGLGVGNPVGLIDETSSECNYKIVIDWSENRFENEESISSLSYTFKLPRLPRLPRL